MVRSQNILSDQGIEVHIHILEENVYVFFISGMDDFDGLDDIWVLELFKVHNLSISSLGICGILEGIKILF